MDELLWTLDRIEGTLAVLEGEEGRTFHLPRALLPGAVREGDVLRVVGSVGSYSATWVLKRDEKETRARREGVDALREELLERDPGGDVTL